MPGLLKVRMVCKYCKSEDVLVDAYASWDYDLQKWELEQTYDKGAYCNSCDKETRVEEKEG